MPGREDALYSRGKYWLDWDTTKAGTLRTPFLTIFWYDETKGRVRSSSTGTTDVTAAGRKLDAKWRTDAGEAHAFCPTCGQSMPDADSYLLTDAIADYREEWGDSRPSAESIKARLKHVVDFLEADVEHSGLATTCEIAAGTPFIKRFRAWSKERPVTWRNGQGIITKSKPRAPSTTEESVLQLIAALNHACDATPPRSDARPSYKPLPRKSVSSKRSMRLDVPVLADMLAYASDNRRRRGLHAFLVASICTIARPDTVVDISTAPQRRQWRPGSATIDLNPAGRQQTKKYRPVLPVLPPLADWLDDTLRLADIKGYDRTGGWLVNYYGRPVQGIETAWETMLQKLGLPRDREWEPYILRHSLATMARGRGAKKWDLEGYMGHHASDQVETYAVDDAYSSVVKALTEVLHELDQRSPGALHRADTGVVSNVVRIGGQKMT